MSDQIDYSKVATASAERFGKLLADSIFELEQWKQLAATAIAERDQLKEAQRSTDEQKQD